MTAGRPHVLVARLDNDGDVLLAGPAIRAVAANAQRVTLLCGPRGAAAAELLPGVDELVVHRAEWIEPQPEPFQPEPTYELLTRLGSLVPPIDEAIVLTSFHQSPLPLALLLRLIGVPRIGATSVDYPGSLLDVRHLIGDDVHEVERSLSLMRTMGHELPPGDDGRLRIRRPVAGTRATDGAHRAAGAGDRERRAAGAPPAATRAFPPGTPYVVVHPGASVPARAWAPQRNAELVAALAARGRNVAVTGGPAERDLTARVAGGTDDVTRAAGAVRDLGGTTTLAQLADVIAGADAIVVGNTGPAHLAAAVGTPVVSIYAPTVPEVRWRPWMVRSAVLHHDVPCTGCRARVCHVPGHPCVDGLSLDVVLAALDRLAPFRTELKAVAA